jgi:hypothetical protein
MSEKLPSSPFDDARKNFDANKAHNESETWLNELQGEAGKSDFSDEARQRLDDIAAYHHHMEQLANDDRSTFDRNYATFEPQEGETPGTIEHAWDEARSESNARNDEVESAASEAAAALDAKIASKTETRFIDMLARQVAELRSKPVTDTITEKDIRTNERRISDLQSQIAERLAKYEESENFDIAVAHALINRTDTGIVASASEAAKGDTSKKADELSPAVRAALEGAIDPSKKMDELSPEVRAALEGATSSSEKKSTSSEELDEATRAALEGATGVAPTDVDNTEKDNDTKVLDKTIREELESAGPEAKSSLFSRAYKRAGELFGKGLSKVGLSRLAPAGILTSGVNVNHFLDNDKDPERKTGKKSSRRATIIGLGIVGLVGGAIAWRYGLLSGGGGGHVDPNHLPPAGGGTVTEHVPPSGSSVSPETFSDAAHTVTPGEGWLSELEQLNIPADQRPAMLQKLLDSKDPKIMGWVYTMQDGNPGISHPGQIPSDVLESIKNL